MSERRTAAEKSHQRDLDFKRVVNESEICTLTDHQMFNRGWNEGEAYAQSELAAAQAENERLRKALSHYGLHKQDCPKCGERITVEVLGLAAPSQPSAPPTPAEWNAARKHAIELAQKASLASAEPSECHICHRVHDLGNACEEVVVPTGQEREEADDLIEAEISGLQRNFESLHTIDDKIAHNLMKPAFRRVYDAGRAALRASGKGD